MSNQELNALDHDRIAWARRAEQLERLLEESEAQAEWSRTRSEEELCELRSRCQRLEAREAESGASIAAGLKCCT